MQELMQLYTKSGEPLAGQGASKAEIFSKGLLHGASEVWIWRRSGDQIELLLQKRGASKQTWPNLLDISAAGHIDLDEEPVTAAIRETSEELGLELTEDDLAFIGQTDQYMVAEDGSIENELLWVYAFQLDDASNLKLSEREVDSVAWKTLEQFKREVRSDDMPKHYVPHPPDYFNLVIGYFEEQRPA